MEQSGSNAEKKRTGLVGNQTTESSRKGVKVDGERAHDFNRVTQHQVRAGGGEGGVEVSAESTTARQYQYWIPIGDKVDRGNPHALQFWIQGMSNVGGYQALGQDCHSLER